jgi:hypothetical protein
VICVFSYRNRYSALTFQVIYGCKLISVLTVDLLFDLGENLFKRSEYNESRNCEFCESRHREGRTFILVDMNSHLCVYREGCDTNEVKKVPTKSVCYVTEHIIYILVSSSKKNHNSQVVIRNFDGESSVATTEYIILFLHTEVNFKQSLIFC